MSRHKPQLWFHHTCAASVSNEVIEVELLQYYNRYLLPLGTVGVLSYYHFKNTSRISSHFVLTWVCPDPPSGALVLNSHCWELRPLVDRGVNAQWNSAEVDTDSYINQLHLSSFTLIDSSASYGSCFLRGWKQKAAWFLLSAALKHAEHQHSLSTYGLLWSLC